MTDSTSQQPPASKRLSPVNIIVALVIIAALVGTTWWMGERNGWATIGTGGSNAQLLPKPGDEAPEFFTLMTTDGENYLPVELSKLRGRPVWMNFWGSWCPPCRAEMPEFISAYDKVTAAGVVVLPISVGEAPEKSLAYRDKIGGSFPILIDPTFIESFIDAEANPETAARYQSMRNDWQIKNYPTHVFIDADGIVQYVFLRQMSEEEMVSTAIGMLEVTHLLPEAIVTRYE